MAPSSSRDPFPLEISPIPAESGIFSGEKSARTRRVRLDASLPRAEGGGVGTSRDSRWEIPCRELLPSLRIPRLNPEGTRAELRIRGHRGSSSSPSGSAVPCVPESRGSGAGNGIPNPAAGAIPADKGADPESRLLPCETFSGQSLGNVPCSFFPGSSRFLFPAGRRGLFNSTWKDFSGFWERR